MTTREFVQQLVAQIRWGHRVGLLDLPCDSCKRTTRIHDRRRRKVTRNIVERTSIGTGGQTRLPPRYGEGEAGFRPRPYCRGEQPMTLLKAVLKALSDS